MSPNGNLLYCIIITPVHNIIGNLRSDLIEQGAISSLVQCISHIDVNVQQTTLEAIALLSIDGPAREQVL